MKVNGSGINQVQPLSKYRRWLTGIALVLGLPVLLYYGYCWGWWGRSSLLLQYLLQCGCPIASNEARYPEYVDVIIPACRHTSSRLSPSGHYLYVQEDNMLSTSGYLLDLQTSERIGEINQPFTSFLTDDLLFVEIGLEDFIFDLTAGKQYPIQRFVHSRSDARIDGETNQTLLAESLQKAENVFLIGASTDTVIALTEDYYKYPERNFTFNRFDLPDFDTAGFLKENQIAYQIILPDFPGEVVSLDGKFIARSDGIYLVGTNDKIAEGISSSVRGWTSDSRAVIYSHALGRCLLQLSFPFADDTACLIRVPQPILLLKVPEEYLRPVPTP